MNAEYVGEDNQKHHPVMLHRAVLGSLERFIGILIENYAGALPAWLQYKQAVVIPVSPAAESYAQSVFEQIKKAGIRADINLGSDRINGKIKTAQLKKIPYMLVAGEKEAADGTVAVRFRDGQDQRIMKIAEFIDYVKDKTATRFAGI